MVEDLPDSYPTVLTDLQTLKDESKIYVVNLGGVEVAYPRDASEQGNIILDDEVHKLFHETQVTNFCVAAHTECHLLVSPTGYLLASKRRALKVQKFGAPIILIEL